MCIRDSLIDYLCESTSWVGSRLDAKDDFPIPIFRNEINALGDFRGGVKVARDFCRHTAPMPTSVVIAIMGAMSGQCRFSNRPVGVKRFQAISHYLSDDPLLQCRCRSRARASLRNRHQGPSIIMFVANNLR